MAPMAVIECETCGGHMEDHARGCPTAAIRETWAKKEPTHECPSCGKWTIELNRESLYECRACGETFKSAHTFDDIESCGTSQDARLDMLRDERLTEKVIPCGKGKGDFQFDRRIKQLEAMERAWQKVRND
jgi:ribosomal protein L37AE/L43A